MGFLAPIGAAITAGASAAAGAIGGITLSGLATGASIVGAGLSIVGGITGNKTLQKVGMGFGIAGGAGLLANGFRGASAARGASSLSSAVDDVLTSPLKGSKMVDRSADLWKAPGAATQSTNKAADLWSKEALVGSQNLPKGSKIADALGAGTQQSSGSLWDNANNTWAKYYPWMAIAGGMGDAYMLNERMDMEKDLRGRALDIEQAQLDRLKQNTQPIGLNLQPTTYARTPLLQYTR